ncbi:MAG: threonine--tRNA ligase [Nanoarchaeota archaeon]|nr:threonine--tRNA ligase [Nanoarchaeota archaeon]MBU1051033.1 threonine--tRNA ligase [Nanoarchaeota archaeon]MBU1988781.1 threonine--tRNA ligase [Nanoarchaeota archaeon]
MKILTLHCDYIKFQPLKKALKKPEEIKSQEEVEVKEPLVILIAIEKGDSASARKQLVESVSKTAKDVNAKHIVLYPYAHLSSNLAAPETAMSALVEAEKSLKKLGFKVTRAPFGYYKSFELKCKGHPLSELSKEFKPEGTEEPVQKGKLVEETYDPARLLKEISRSKLDTSKLKENDHRILGQKLDLFSFNDVAPGAVFWHNNGLIIYNELVKYWREEHEKAGYKEILTPQILDKKLWQISGHWDKYKENNFVTAYEDRPFLIKPMNCPGGILVFKTQTRSYKDLPMRVGELGVVHRQELSGVLAGLFRLIKFTQDDAHIYCTEEQLEKELIAVIDIADLFYKKFNLPYRVELSTRPEKRIGSDEDWDKAEKALHGVLKKKKMKYKLNKGDGAFYGPKIDFHIKDSLDREWQCATLQLDFAMPERFQLEYVGKDNKRHMPIMLHRTIYGALERFMGIILEHTNGNLPVWLSPTQVRVINFTDRNNKAVEKLVKDIKKEIQNLRIDIDLENTTVSDKVRNAEIQRIPYMIVIGDKEEKGKTLAVRARGHKPKFGVKIDSFVKEVREKIEKRV